MIRSSACVAADDVSVRCRVRRSPFCTNPRFDVAMETLCTMRHWTPTKGSQASSSNGRSSASSKHHHHKEGPELVLQTVQDVLESRDSTPGRYRRRSSSGSQLHAQVAAATTASAAKSSGSAPNSTSSSSAAASISVPLSEIVVVERWPRRHYKLTLTTIHQGMLEFDLRNSNRHDMLLAFLQAHMPAERIQYAASCAEHSSVHSTCSSKSQMDVEKLQERTMRRAAAAEDESWPEKLTRRMSKALYSIQTMSGTLCDLAVCGRDGSTNVAASPTTTDIRDAAPSTPSLEPVSSWTMANGGHLEMDEEISTTMMYKQRSTASSSRRNRKHDAAATPTRLV